MTVALPWRVSTTGTTAIERKRAAARAAPCIISLPLVPANAGTQFLALDSRLRGNERSVRRSVPDRRRARRRSPDIDAGEQEQPHHVDEVPVPSGEFEAEMVRRREVALVGTK